MLLSDLETSVGGARSVQDSLHRRSHGRVFFSSDVLQNIEIRADDSRFKQYTHQSSIGLLNWMLD